MNSKTISIRGLCVPKAGELILKPIAALTLFTLDHEDIDELLSGIGYLIDSVSHCGLLDPLTITADGKVLRCRRLFEAARRVGLDSVPCVVLPIRSKSSKFLSLQTDLVYQGVIR